MAADSAAYARHFQAARRVKIAVPLADGTSFEEWGKVSSLQADLLEVELSRDSLPQEAALQVGHTIQLGLPRRGQSLLACHGRVAGWRERHRLLLHLLGEPAPYEQRQFFRQDVTIPLEYRLPPSQIPQEVREHWRQCRWAAEFASQQPDPDEALELTLLRDDLLCRLERRKAAPPVAVNLSGGGMRLNLKEKLHPGMLVEFGIFLPQPRKLLEVVGEVVQVTASASQDRFSTALRYRLIDEADRDRLIGYIASQQLRQLSQQDPAPPAVTEHPPASTPRLPPLRLTIALLILTGLLSCQVHSVLVARERGEKHEIARLFEQGIMDFLRLRR